MRRLAFENQMGPLFKVEYAFLVLGPETEGIVITHRGTGNWVWVTPCMSILDACGKLIRAQESGR